MWIRIAPFVTWPADVNKCPRIHERYVLFVIFCSFFPLSSSRFMGENKSQCFTLRWNVHKFTRIGYLSAIFFLFLLSLFFHLSFFRNYRLSHEARCCHAAALPVARLLIKLSFPFPPSLFLGELWIWSLYIYVYICIWYEYVCVWTHAHTYLRACVCVWKFLNLWGTHVYILWYKIMS